MKKLLLIPLLVAAINVFGQGKPKIRYFEYKVEFTLTSGCESSAMASYYTTNNHAISYNEAKSYVAKWVKPNKLKAFKLSSVREIKKSEQQKTAKFKCPEPLKWLFSDTAKLTSSLLYVGSPVAGFSSLQPSSVVWHWGDNKMPMTWLPKPNITNIDSVEIYVPKRLTYWLNDSTLIIKKR